MPPISGPAAGNGEGYYIWRSRRRAALPVRPRQIVQASPADLGLTQHFDLIYARRSKEEGAFYAYTVGRNTTHGEATVDTALAHADDNSLENLHALFLTFNDQGMHAYRIASFELRDVLVNSSLI